MMKKKLAMLMSCIMIFNINTCAFAHESIVKHEPKYKDDTTMASDSDAMVDEYGVLLDGYVYKDVLATCGNAASPMIVDDTYDMDYIELNPVGYADVDSNHSAIDALMYSPYSWGEQDTCYKDQLEEIQRQVGYDGLETMYQTLESGYGHVEISLGLLGTKEISSEEYNDDAKWEKVKENIQTEYYNYIRIVSDSFAYDHPEMFWDNKRSYGLSLRIRNNDQYTGFDVSITGTFKYDIENYDDETVSDMLQLQNEALEDLADETTGVSEYARLKSLHNNIAYSTSYDSSLSGKYSHDIWGGLIGNSTPSGDPMGKTFVCEGYAKLFKTMCDRMDIPCILARGQAGTGDTKGGHMWNYVRMSDDKWYAVDLTWDDPDMDNRMYYHYFLSGSQTIGFNYTTFFGSHEEEYAFSNNGWEFVYPTLETEKYVPQSGIVFDKENAILDKGDTLKIKAVMLPDENEVSLDWSSSDSKVATVDSSGVVTAKSRGYTTIKGTTTEGMEATCVIEVREHVSGISISESSLTMNRGETFELSAHTIPDTANESGILWEVADLSVATISADGLVAAIKPGSTKVIATTIEGGYKAECSIIVVVPVMGVELSDSQQEIVGMNNTCVLTAAVIPSDATNKALTWISSNPEVASVDETGKVVSHQAGKTTITVSSIDGKYSKQCEITSTKSQDDLIKEYVTRSYKLILGRDPDEFGLQGWSDALKTGNMGGSDLVMAFLRSNEFTGRGLSNSEIVEIAYQTMLGRASDAGGKAGWAEILDAGCSTTFLVSGFSASAEFRDICSSYGISIGGVPITENRDRNIGVTKFIARNYSKVLGRPADIDGLNGWTGLLINKQLTPQQVLSCFALSAESLSKSRTDDQYIEMLYEACLGRSSDVAGKQGWLNVMKNGMSRETVLGCFAYSEEFKEIIAKYGL